jgi:hypothetical protein
MGKEGNLVQGKELREAPHQMVAGGSSSTPGAHFWGSEGEEEGQQEVHGGGSGAQGAGCFDRPAGNFGWLPAGGKTVEVSR